MYYVNEKNLIQVERADEDFLLYGVHPVKAGDIVATDGTGFQYVIDEEMFYSNFVGVRKIRHPRKTRKSPFEMAAIAEAYQEMGNLVKKSNENEENYIF